MLKRTFDFIVSFFALVICFPLLVIVWLMATIDTRSNGLFLQERIGQYGVPFLIFKIKTVHPGTRKISWFGAFLRKSKIDELPQLLNIVLGQMSLVGPRPDIPGYYDLLEGESRKILTLKPGLTSEASLKYANEESLLLAQADPLHYNDTVIFPDKVALNLRYYYEQNFWLDLTLLLRTVFNF